MPKKPAKLPTGVQLHYGKYRIWYLVQGARHWEVTGTDLRAAVALRNRRIREIAEGSFEPDAKGRPTVASYARKWIDRRKVEGEIRTVDREDQILRDHVLPVLGEKRLEDLRKADVRDWISGLRGAGKLAAKSIRNIHGVLATMLQDAVDEELITTNPAHRPKNLPAVSKRKRQPPPRGNAEVLMTDAQIDEERRVLYSLLFLTGMRLGEACGRRWRDIDPARKPLHLLSVSSQYDDQPLKTAKGDDDAARQVPVHPELARILADWKLRGFAAAFGRLPRPEDFIVPDDRTMGPRTKNQALKGLYRDCDRVSIPRTGTHAGRRWFVSSARSYGAAKDVVNRITHNPRGEMIDEYTYYDWEALCEAVMCLRVDFRRGQVLAFPKAANGPDEAGPCAENCAEVLERPVFQAEMGGGAGSRTRVRKWSRAASTHVVS